MNYRTPLFRLVNFINRLMPHKARRFVLDRLCLGVVFGAMARNQFGELVLADGQRLTYNLLLHGNWFRGGRVAYEDHICAAIKEALGGGSVFYDVGANVGVFSLLAAGIVGPSGIVIAFEPEENNLVCLRRSIAANGIRNIRIAQNAVGATDGVMTFDRRGGAFSGRIVAHGEKATGSTVEVPVRSIDNLVEEGWPPPSLIKIDVEGSEGDVLEGLAQTLAKHHPVVICEMHEYGTDGPTRALQVLNSAGYSLRRLERPRSMNDDPTYHVLALPRSSAEGVGNV